ncbi:hypothetical protein LX16_2431 [Stackebrandtia albiflava]|uniref:Adhesin n=2 Tax=Stackebrandtia albiflava TaxID=406432 RepID=A0A562V1F2_9ACTN|nr:hypothetical protein LX16_2431 [Stackebrandtia albiflava]
MRAFPTPTPISATVDVVMGDIRFVATDRIDTVVGVDPLDPGRALDVEAAAQVRVEYAQGRLRVSHPRLRSAFTRRFGSVRVLVELPTGSDVRGDTAQGEHVVRGAVGSCRLKTAIGDIRVERAAEARLKTTGGRVIVDHVTGSADVAGYGGVRIGRVEGPAVVHDLGGDITVGVAGSDVEARTANGRIRLGEVREGTVDLYAAIGGLEIGAPHGTHVRLDARATTGRVRGDLGTSSPTDRTVAVRARCHGGDIVVRRVESGHDVRHGAARLSG